MSRLQIGTYVEKQKRGSVLGRAGKRATQLSFGVMWQKDKKMKTIAALVLLLVAIPINAISAEEGQLEYREGIFTDKVYAVVFAFTVQNDMTVDGIKIAQVLDGSSGEPKEVELSISDEYFETAQRLIKEKGYKPTIKDGKTIEKFTYFLYSPEYPNVVITKRAENNE